MAVGLQDGVGQGHDADEDAGDAQHPQMGARRGGGSLLCGVQRQQNGPGQHAEAHTRRDRQNSDEPESGGDDAVGALMVFSRHRRRREGNEAHGDGVHEGRRQVDEVHAEGVLAVQGGRGVRQQLRDGAQPTQDDLAVDEGDDAHGRVAEGDGDADGQHLFHQRPGALRHVQGFRAVPVGEQVEDQEEHGQHGAHGDAQNGAGGADLHTVAQPQEIPGQGQSDGQLAQGLQHLGDGGGLHVPLALGIAPHAGQQTHAEYGGSQGLDGPVGQRVVHKACQLRRAEEHEQRQHQAQGEEQPDGGAEQLPLLILPAQGVGLAGQLGDGQGQAGGGDGQQQVIDVVRHREVGLALVADDVAQGDLIHRADELHDDHGGGQNRGAAQERLLFGLIRHEVYLE